MESLNPTKLEKKPYKVEDETTSSQSQTIFLLHPSGDGVVKWISQSIDFLSIYKGFIQ